MQKVKKKLKLAKEHNERRNRMLITDFRSGGEGMARIIFGAVILYLNRYFIDFGCSFMNAIPSIKIT
jgi:hypothetical protein